MQEDTMSPHELERFRSGRRVIEAWEKCARAINELTPNEQARVVRGLAIIYDVKL